MITIAALIAFASAQAPAQAPQGALPPEGPPASADLISRAEALAIAQESIYACERRGETAVALVTDANGRLRAGLSSDNASAAGFFSAPRKSATVLAFHASTRELQARLAADPAFASANGADPHYFFHPGALPIYKAGKFVAVLAVGGGHDKDEACALDALKLLPWARTKP